MKFNMNDNVKVKLTKKGVGIYYSQNDELNKHCRTPHIPPKLVVDSDGFCSFQMHELMLIFGSHCRLGMNPPFETEIILSEVN